MKTAGYSIKDLEVLSGIKAHTIRIWEKRYNLLTPHRTDTNIRYYDDDDLKKILNVALLVKNGFKISKVAKWDEDKVRDSVLEVTGEKKSESDYTDRLLLYMLNFDNVGFSQLTNEIVAELGMEDAVYKVFFDFFVKIGTFWQVDSIFPAQEHYVTNIFRQKLISEIDRLKPKTARGLSMLFFLPEQELHELSLLFYSYLAKKMGYEVIYLGQFVPFEDLKKLEKKVNVDFVFTAFINSLPKEELEKYLLDLKDLFVKQKIFVTGWQLQIHQPELPRNVKIVKDYKDFKKYLR